MKRLILLILLCAVPVWGAQYQAIIYSDFRTPAGEELLEHWKPEIPDVGLDEVIRDFYLLAKQGSKRVYHALVDTSNGSDGQVGRIKDYIRGVNGCTAPTLQGPTCTTAVGSQILIWWAKDADGAFTQLWQDRSTHAVMDTIARTVINYPVETTCDGGPCTRIVSAKDAVDVYGETIDPSKLMVPHRFFGK